MNPARKKQNFDPYGFGSFFEMVVQFLGEHCGAKCNYYAAEFTHSL